MGLVIAPASKFYAKDEINLILTKDITVHGTYYVLRMFTVIRLMPSYTCFGCCAEEALQNGVNRIKETQLIAPRLEFRPSRHSAHICCIRCLLCADAVTKYHQPSGLKFRELILLQFRRLEAQNQGV